MAHYWISKKSTFGRDIKFGDVIENLDKDRTKELIGKGLVSTKKPESITNAEKNKISEIGEVNKSLRDEVLALKGELDEATKPKGK